MAKAKKSRSRLLSWSLVLWSILTIVSYLGPLLNPKTFGFAIGILLLYPVVLLINILLLFLFLYQFKLLYSAFALLLLLVGWPIHSKLVSLFGSDSVPLQTDYKLVTFNSNYGYGIEDHQNSNSKDLIALLNEYKPPDILCLQEYIPDLGDWFEAHYNFKNLVNKAGYRTAIYTNFEVLDRGFILFGNRENSCTWADIQLSDQSVIRLYNIHLQSNQITDETRRIKDVGLEWDKSSLKAIGHIFMNYSQSSAKRVEQIDTLLNHIYRSPHPVIICGDLNDVAISYTYRRIAFGQKDSFLEAGRGRGITYAGALPFLRIDYAFFNPNFKVVKHDVIRSDFSDHHPVAVWFR